MKAFVISLFSALTLVLGASAEIVVTTTSDTVNANDDVMSLREAIALAQSDKGKSYKDADGFYRIAFGTNLFENVDSVAIELSGDTIEITGERRIEVVGPGGSCSVSINDAYDNNDYNPHDIFSVGSNCTLRLRNLKLASSRKADFSETGFFSFGNLELFNCAIGGNIGRQIGFMIAAGSCHFERCSFVSTAAINRGIIEMEGDSRGQTVACTFSNIVFWNGPAFWLKDKAALCFCNTTFGNVGIGGDNRNGMFLSVGNSASAWMISCVLGSDVSTKQQGGVSKKSVVSNVSLGTLQTKICDGVPQSYYPLSTDDNSGVFVGHSTDWSVIFICTQKNGGDRTYIRGTGTVSAGVVVRDIVGREIYEGHVSPGSYATQSKLEKMNPAAIVVNSRSDNTHTSDEDLFTARFELREVVDFLKAHPELRDANGGAKITFDQTSFTDQLSERLRMGMSQIEIDGFTAGKLVIDGGGDESHVMFDGARYAGGANTNRLFYVAPGNRVEFRNLEFVNGVANTSGTAVKTHGGGAIFNRGEILVTNCSFRACSAGSDSAGHADGGAILTDCGAKSVLYGVTIENCSAARGGAIAALNGGTNVIAMSTLMGNRAERGSQPGTVAGGAIYCEGDLSRTVVVNASVTGNVSDGIGGGVRSTGSGKSTTLYLLDTVVVGNHANGKIDDLDLGNVTKARYCVLGRRTPSLDRLFDTEATNVEEGKSSVDVFAHVANNGAGIATAIQVLGVAHSTLPLANDREHSSVVPIVDVGWNSFGYKAGSVTNLFFGNLRQVRQGGKSLTLDQSGNAFNLWQVGASSFAIAPDIPYHENPLLVTSATVEALNAAIDNAEANPALADADGIFNIVFVDDASSISFNGKEAISPMVPIRICGPIEFKDASAGVFTIGSSVPLYLEQVAFTNCKRYDVGGAIYGENAQLYAEDCVFSNCRAFCNDGDIGCVGGAICLVEAESSAVLVNCEFSDCKAQDGTYASLGQSIYHDDRNLRLVDCVFNGSTVPNVEQVYDVSRVRIDRSSAGSEISHRYFDTATAAIADCVSGDKLVVVSADCPDVDVISNSLPNGVSFAIETGTPPPAGSLLANTLCAVAKRTTDDIADKDWLKVSMSASGVEIALDEKKAEPKLDENSEVDMSGADGAVYVKPSNIKPGLFYGLGRSETAFGEYIVERWLEADADGHLPDSLSASKSGESGFYRVIVRQ